MLKELLLLLSGDQTHTPRGAALCFLENLLLLISSDSVPDALRVSQPPECLCVCQIDFQMRKHQSLG